MQSVQAALTEETGHREAARRALRRPPRAFDAESDGMDPPAFLSVEVAGRGG